MQKITDCFIIALAMILFSLVFFKVMFVMLAIPGNTWQNAVVPGIAYTGIMAIFGTILFQTVTE